MVSGNLSFITNYREGPIYLEVKFILGYTPNNESYVAEYFQIKVPAEIEKVKEKEHFEDAKNCSANIDHISALGEVKVKFNESLDLSRLRTLNWSMMDIYVEPAGDRIVERGHLNLTWNFTSI